MKEHGSAIPPKAQVKTQDRVIPTYPGRECKQYANLNQAGLIVSSPTTLYFIQITRCRRFHFHKSKTARRETRTANKSQKASKKKATKPATPQVESTGGRSAETQLGRLENGAELVIPVTAEELEITKEQVTTGSVRVSKQVTERTETVAEPTVHEEVEIERVPVDRFVDAPPEVRVEGDITIIPVVEEVLVVEKRIRVKEEIRVTRKRKEVKDRQQVNLRSEEVKVERRNEKGNQNQ